MGAGPGPRIAFGQHHKRANMRAAGTLSCEVLAVRKGSIARYYTPAPGARNAADNSSFAPKENPMKKFLRASVLAALTLALASCESSPVGTPGAGGTPAAARATSTSTQDSAARPFRVLPADEATVTERAVIGPLGGVLYFGNHSITVPIGAVTQPTLFTGTQVGNGYIHVDLTARQRDARGEWTVDVGRRGFQKPISLRLSYANASSINDPSKLAVLYLADGTVDGTLTPVPTSTNRIGRWLYARLSHFSGYGAGEGRSDPPPGDNDPNDPNPTDPDRP
jgi:hypothetical protein